MSFTVTFASAPPSVVRRIRAAMFVFATTACALALAGAERSDTGWIVAIAAASFVLALRRSASGLSGGRLTIDGSGRAAWQPTDPAYAAQTVYIERWSLVGPLAWLRVRLADQNRARDLLLLCEAHDEDSWRKLRGWLIWLGRGRARPRAAPTTQ